MGALQTASYVFGVIGVATLLPQLYRLLVFGYVYFPGLHDGNMKRYLWSKRPYALITGSTNGIGKALAKELYSRGFNLIIHGRSPEKLASVREEILEAGFGDRDVRVWCEDAAQSHWDPAELLALTEGLDVTVVALVNGGSEFKTTPIDGQKDEEVHHVMSLNFFFSVFVLRTLLPSLRATAARGPVSLFALSSIVTISPLPFLSVYAAGKLALEAVMRGVAADERFEGRGRNLEVKYIQLAGVSSGNGIPPDWQTPTSEAFAKDIVRRIRAPWTWAAANTTHAMMIWSVGLLTERMNETISAGVVRDLMKKSGKRLD